jgi:polyhydroxyalkanoate synthesis regulator protein
MKLNDTNLEPLSAYLDGELSSKEASEVEEKLKNSLDLQNKLSELKKIKAYTKSAYKPIEENPYFETRLLASLYKPKSAWSKVKKLSPVFSIILLTVAVGLILKINPTMIKELFEQQKSNITGFYKENLRPLLYAANLTNEDIFNFAFYKRLPLDENDKKFLQIGFDPNGKQVFEIKNINLGREANNLEKFAASLNLTPKQRAQVDSIIALYAIDLQGQVLVNDKNCMAVSSNLWYYQKALASDLLAFAEKTNKDQFRRIIPSGYSFASNQTAPVILREINKAGNDNYIFFTPDSIFTEKYRFDKDKFEEAMKNFGEQMKNMKKEMKNFDVHIFIDSSLTKRRVSPLREKDFKVFIDTNLFRVEIENLNIPEIVLPDFDSLSIIIENSVRNYDDAFRNYTFYFPPDRDFNLRNRIERIDSSFLYNFKYTIPDVDSILRENKFRIDSVLKGKTFSFDSMKVFDFDSRFFHPDSSRAFYKYFLDDSGKPYFNNEQLRDQMEMLRKEMEKFREEMRDLKKDLRKDIEETEKEVIEI